MKTFAEFIKEDPCTDDHALVIQAIAIISSLPDFTGMAPNEIYDHLVTQVAAVQVNCTCKLDRYKAPEQHLKYCPLRLLQEQTSRYAQAYGGTHHRLPRPPGPPKPPGPPLG